MNYIFLIFLLVILLICLLFNSFIYKENFENNELFLLSIFKNETSNLKVWIEHYLWQGVDKIYLIDNNSTDNPLNILQPYIDSGVVDYTFDQKKYNQLQSYRDLITEKDLKNKTKWLIICDLDEFYYGSTKKLKETLNEFDNYDIIYSNWKMFGSNGLIQHPEDIRKSIIYRKLELDTYSKYIIKLQNININDIDVHFVNNNENYIRENEKIKLNHYPIQSLTYFQTVKMIRGDVATPANENVRNIEYFNKYDMNTTFKDTELKDLIINGY